MTAVVLRGDARCLPLPDASVDLIVTSPPYFGLRSYTDGGEHYDGQIGSEATPQEWLAALVECTAEFVRVLKPSGSLFVNLGDKYASSGTTPIKARSDRPDSYALAMGRRTRPTSEWFPHKSLMGLPWRYAIAATDQLGLILRRDIIWSKPNGLPESVTDRCRSSHEYLFHLVKQPRYYAAVDEIREAHLEPQRRGVLTWDQRRGRDDAAARYSDQNGHGGTAGMAQNPLGKLPGSVWTIPSQPLTVPTHLGIDHFAAFPMELPRRCILGWSPPGVCTVCGEGRRPVVDVSYSPAAARGGTGAIRRNRPLKHDTRNTDGYRITQGRFNDAVLDKHTTITAYACACTLPCGECTDGVVSAGECTCGSGDGLHDAACGFELCPNGCWDQNRIPPTRPAIVLDPFGGTGTTALVAAMHGRLGISIDRSADYSRLAAWRTQDPAQRAAALGVPKPPPVPDGMEPLFAI